MSVVAQALFKCAIAEGSADVDLDAHWHLETVTLKSNHTLCLGTHQIPILSSWTCHGRPRMRTADHVMIRMNPPHKNPVIALQPEGGNSTTRMKQHLRWVELIDGMIKAPATPAPSKAKSKAKTLSKTVAKPKVKTVTKTVIKTIVKKAPDPISELLKAGTLKLGKKAGKVFVQEGPKGKKNDVFMNKHFIKAAGYKFDYTDKLWYKETKG